MDFPVILEEFNRFCHRHLQNVVDGSPAIHLKTFSSVPFSIADVAGDHTSGRKFISNLMEPPLQASQRPPLTLKLKWPGL